MAAEQPPSPANSLFHPISVHSEKRFQGFIPQAMPVSCSPAFVSDVVDLHLDIGLFSLYVIVMFALTGLMAEGGHWLRYPPLAMGPTPPAPRSR